MTRNTENLKVSLSYVIHNKLTLLNLLLFSLLFISLNQVEKILFKY